MTEQSNDNVRSTRGLYAIEVTVPKWNSGRERRVIGHHTVTVATYEGERWRAKHQAKTAWQPRFPEGKVTVRWIGHAAPKRDRYS